MQFLGRPGLRAYATCGPGPHRARFEENGRAFVVSGEGFYEVANDGTATLRGTMTNTRNEPASIHGNGPGGGQLMVISDGLGYIFTLGTNTFAQITDPDFPTDVVMGFYIKGHFGVIKRDSREFALSNEFDGTAWDALDAGEITATTGYLVAALVDKDNNELWLIGPQRAEIWQYTGAAAFPLEPVPNLVVQTGAAAPWSWIDVGGTIYGVGQSEERGQVVVRFRGGYRPEPISTPIIDAALQAFAPANLAAGRGFALEHQGHWFYGLTFTEAKRTFVFDELTGEWHEWTYWNAATATSEAFLGVTHMFAFGRHLMGSRKDGALMEWTPEALDDVGVEIRARRIAHLPGAGPRTLFFKRLWFNLRVGVGTGSGQGQSPVAMVRTSMDAGKTWSTQRTVSLGQMGQYGTLVELWRLGRVSPTGCAVELVITDPVVRGIYDADADLVGEAA